MSITLDGSSGITAPTYGGVVASEYSVPVTAFKNRIINGAMMIDQRNAGASVTPTGSAYTLDRWQLYATQSSKVSVQQNAGSVTPPVGFTNYLGITSLSAYSVGASDYFSIGQPIEGFNIADLAWGTANAKTITVSAWVYSSLTGTFGGSVGNASRSYPFSYSIPVANTWTQVSVTIPGDTSGTYNKTNGTGMYFFFTAAAGSSMVGTAGSWQSGLLVAPTGQTSVVGTNGATFYITGAQLEKGSTATSFDYRPYGTEFQLCQRYYETGQYEMSIAAGPVGTSNISVHYSVRKRANPTVTATNSFNVGGGSNESDVSLWKAGSQSTTVGFTSSAEL